MTNDVEYLLMCLLVICVSSLGKCLFVSFDNFLKINQFIYLAASCPSCGTRAPSCAACGTQTLSCVMWGPVP